MKFNILSLCAVVIVAIAFYWLGSRTASPSHRVVDEVESELIERGEKLGHERSAWLNAANLYRYVAHFDYDRVERLPQVLVWDMWYTVPNLYSFVHNFDASDGDREAATRILRKVVLYFYKHPKQIEEPNETDVATQDLLNRLFEEREFPCKKRSALGMTFMMPKPHGGGSSSSSESEFDYSSRDKTLTVNYTNSRLLVNGKYYGALEKGSVIDLREPDHVYVNDIERYPTQNN